MPVVKPMHIDVFKPFMVSPHTVALDVSIEQLNLIKKVLDISSSDTRFAQKAFDAIVYILTSGTIELPIVSSLNPSTAAVGDPSFTISVIGVGFTANSKIIWNGSEEPTTYVSETELTTQVNMALVTVPSTVYVAVQNDTGALSEPLPFEITDPVIADPTTTVKHSPKSDPIKSVPSNPVSQVSVKAESTKVDQKK